MGLWPMRRRSYLVVQGTSFAVAGAFLLASFLVEPLVAGEATALLRAARAMLAVGVTAEGVELLVLGRSWRDL